MKMKEKSLKTQMISNEFVLSVMKPSVVLWNFPSIFIRNILRILPTLFAHSAPSTLGKDTFDHLDIILPMKSRRNRVKLVQI